MTSLFAELRRRNVFRVAFAYLVLAWIVLQVGETLAPALHLPEWVNSLLVFFAILGLPFALFFAWAFELTPDGLKKEKDVDRSQSITNTTGRKLDFSIIALLVAALAYFIWASQDNVQPVQAESPVAAQVPDISRFIDLIELPETAGPSIAVLPFVNMSSDEEQEYFSDGLSEELLNVLARIPDLRVASRTSAFSYKGKNVTIPEVGRELNVAHVLEGSVRKSGTRVRITAQLIDVETDTHLWSATWDRTLDDVFAIQDEIAQVVVDQLKVELMGEAPQVAETTPEVFAMVLQARHHIRRRSSEGYAVAESLLQKAVGIDPDYAPAWAALSRSYVFSGAIDYRGAREAARIGQEAANRALSLNPQNTTAIISLARAETILHFDYATSAAYVERVLSINPGDSEALNFAAGLAFTLGDFETGKRLGRIVVERDPLATFAHLSFATSAYFAGNLDDAIAAYEKVIELNPDTVGSHYYISLVLLAQGKLTEALDRIQHENLDGFRLTAYAIVHHALGNDDESDAALAALNELAVDWAYQRVMVYAYRDELDKAFEWLDTAIEIRDRGVNLVLGDPIIDNLRDDPRFAAVLKRLNRTAVR